MHETADEGDHEKRVESATEPCEVSLAVERVQGETDHNGARQEERLHHRIQIIDGHD